ncbi:transporter [Massilia niastensis]|uniref:transporter n=1 Tax=Massilia niastensis TaxID=544911 RepID=UPI000365F003|nr:transporter [Massilia niastensis]
MSKTTPPSIPHFAACLMLGCAGVASAAEGFEPRYNLAGSLGGEMFAPPNETGWLAAMVGTHIDVSRVTGNDGKAMTRPIPGGVVGLPASLPAGFSPSYGAGTAAIEATGTMTRWDLVFGYLMPGEIGGGRMVFAVDLPFARKNQSMMPHAGTARLDWPAGAPGALRPAVEAQFGAQYQAALQAQGAGASGEISGIGDVEVLAGWQYLGEKLRVLASTALVLPTGKYATDAKPDIGSGNFTTLRPALQLAYLPTPKLALAAKLSVGLNTRNRDNQLRSGNWAGVETAIGYMTPIGVLGLHAIRLQQYQDDDNNPLGPSRIRSTNAGAFFTTKIPGLDAALTIQHIATLSSRNAKDANFTQVRLIKVF